jgi:ATP-dependent Clp protease ATP-binding subunit ClpC
LGFNASAGIMDVREIRDSALSELKRLFNPEFINRIDDIVVFHALDRSQVEAVFNIQIEELQKRLVDRGFSLEIRPAARNLLVEKGYDPKFGARPMRRVIQRDIEDALSLLLLEKDHQTGSVFVVGVKGKDLDIRVKKTSPVAASSLAELSSLRSSLVGAKGTVHAGIPVTEAIKQN